MQSSYPELRCSARKVRLFMQYIKKPAYCGLLQYRTKIALAVTAALFGQQKSTPKSALLIFFFTYLLSLFGHRKTAYIGKRLIIILFILKITYFRMTIFIVFVIIKYLFWYTIRIGFAFMCKCKIEYKMLTHYTFAFRKHIYHPFLIISNIIAFNFLYVAGSCLADNKSATYS